MTIILSVAILNLWNTTSGNHTSPHPGRVQAELFDRNVIPTTAQLSMLLKSGLSKDAQPGLDVHTRELRHACEVRPTAACISICACSSPGSAQDGQAPLIWPPQQHAMLKHACKQHCFQHRVTGCARVLCARSCTAACTPRPP